MTTSNSKHLSSRDAVYQNGKPNIVLIIVCQYNWRREILVVAVQCTFSTREVLAICFCILLLVRAASINKLFQLFPTTDPRTVLAIESSKCTSHRCCLLYLKASSDIIRSTQKSGTKPVLSLLAYYEEDVV